MTVKEISSHEVIVSGHPAAKISTAIIKLTELTSHPSYTQRAIETHSKVLEGNVPRLFAAWSLFDYSGGAEGEQHLLDILVSADSATITTHSGETAGPNSLTETARFIDRCATIK